MAGPLLAAATLHPAQHYFGPLVRWDRGPAGAERSHGARWATRPSPDATQGMAKTGYAGRCLTRGEVHVSFAIAAATTSAAAAEIDRGVRRSFTTTETLEPPHAMAATLAGSALALGANPTLSRSSPGASGVANSARSSWRAPACSQITARLPALRSSFLAKPVVGRFGAEFNPLSLTASKSLKNVKAVNVGRNVASPVCMASAADSAGENVPE